MSQVFLITLLIFVVLIRAHSTSSLLVDIAQGTVQGQVATDGNYVTFYGIPYAGNVDNQNRFKDPPPAPPLPDIFIANDPNIVCAQPTLYGPIGEENCLVLNIMTKNITGSRPVMVWINGHQYATGTNQGLDFRRFIEIEDILIVTLNYRLSIFGFLCLGVYEAPGNAGLKDIIAGLKWIRNNIPSFGGNASNILLAGHGSGASLVDLISLSPLSNGLIHKAIAQSGNSLSPWSIAYTPIQNAQAVGIQLNFTGNNNTALAKFLADVPFENLIPVLINYQIINNSYLFAPCLENINLETNMTFMTEPPINILRSGNYSSIPFITGFTNREGSERAEMAMNNDWLNLMETNFRDFIQIDLKFENAPYRSDISSKIREFYFEDRTINFNSIDEYLDFHGDTIVVVSCIRAAVERAKTSNAEVRLYEFGYIGNWSSEWEFPKIPLNGGRHGQELVYLLGTGTRFKGGVVNEKVRDTLVGRWAAFARTGIPQSTNLNPWSAVTPDEVKILEFVEVTSVNVPFENIRTNPHKQRMEFWNSIYKHYYITPKPVSSAYSFSFRNSFLIVYTVIILVKFIKSENNN